MENNNNKEKIIDILSTLFEKKVSMECSHETEEMWDSITHLEIIVTIEEEFGIKIPEDKIPEMTSVKKILEVIDSLK